MGQTHRVQQGECVASIAHDYGFADWQIVWDAPQNERLRALRDDPYVLHPGDELFVPDRRPNINDCAAGQRHRFVRVGGRVPYKLVLKTADGTVFSDRKYKLSVGTLEFDGRTGSNGEIEQQIPVSATSATLVLWPQDHDDSTHGVKYSLRIGHLDPVDTIPGIQARLRNLGYHASESGELDDATCNALKRFQKKHDLDATGEIDDATREKLFKAHRSET